MRIGKFILVTGIFGVSLISGCASSGIRKPASFKDVQGGQINIRIDSTDNALNLHPIVTVNPTIKSQGLWISGTAGPMQEGPVECLITPELAKASDVDLVALAKEISSNDHSHFECMRSAGDNKATWFQLSIF